MEPQEKVLAFGNQFHEFGTQIVEGTDCIVSPFPVITPTNNLVTLDLTQGQLLELLSSIQVGAEWAYPNKSQQILFNFMKGLVCPPILEEQDCFEYKTFASFIKFDPINPYIEPDTVPDGYLVPPFILNTEDGVPVPNYAKFDVLVPFDSLTLDVDWFDDIGGQLPQVRVIVEGEGQVFLRLLNQVAGGLAVITVDNPPNILDIIGGVLTGAENIIDLNLDIVSLPPETAEEIIFPVSLAGSGLHTIYVVFLPILDDSLLPVRFGGGFRGVQLCDFVEQPEMGIQDIRFNELTCNLETLVEGEWEAVAGWENWLDCVPSGGGGGGGGGGALATVHKQDLGAATVTSTATSAAGVTGASFSHTFTKSKAIVICHAYVQHSGASAVCQIRANVAGATFVDNSYQEWIGTNLRVLAIANSFEAIPLGSNTVALTWFTSGGTMTMNNSSLPQFIILEFDDAGELFVEDIRIVDNELQKKIAGVWIPVVDSLADILNSLQSAVVAAQADADTALAQNVTQQSQINSIVTVNNNQNARLDDLEDWQSDVDLSIAGLNAQVIDHETRIDALEAAIGGASVGGVWSHELNFATSEHGFSLLEGLEWDGGFGFRFNTNGLEIQRDSLILENQITHIRVQVIPTAALSSAPYFRVNSGDQALWKHNGINFHSFGWSRVPNRSYTSLNINFAGSGNAYLYKMLLLGRGENPFI